MNTKFQGNITHMTDSLERELLEQELRAMAQRAAAEAVARGLRRVFAKLRSMVTGSRHTSSTGLHSA